MFWQWLKWLLCFGLIPRPANPNLSPHEQWPEILRWKAGDEFETRGWPYYKITLISLTASGGAYCKVDWDHRAYLSVSGLVGHNISLRDRGINSRLKQQNEYMELLAEFNKAVAELEARDKQNGVSV